MAPRFRPLPAARRAQREGAGKASGPRAPPAPRPRGKAREGARTSLLKAFTASMSRPRWEPGGFSPLMAAGPGLGSLCACAPRSGAAGPPRHGGWRRGRARRDAGPARFRLLPAARGLLAPTSRPAAPTFPPPSGSARPRREEMEEQGAAAAARAPIWRTRGGSSQRSSERSRERRRRLQRHLPDSARTTEALPDRARPPLSLSAGRGLVPSGSAPSAAAGPGKESGAEGARGGSNARLSACEGSSCDKERSSRA